MIPAGHKMSKEHRMYLVWIALLYILVGVAFYYRNWSKAVKAGQEFNPEIQKALVIHALVWPAYVSYF